MGFSNITKCIKLFLWIFFLLAFIKINVVTLIACPIDKIVKKHYSFSLFISTLPLVLRLFHIYAPFPHDWYSHTELFKCNSCCAVFLNSLKSHKVFIVLSHVLEKEAELGLFNLVISLVLIGMRFAF